VKGKIQVMVTERVSLMVSPCRCGGGRTGSVRGFASSNAKRGDGEKWSAHIRQATTLAMVTCSAPAGQIVAANSMAPTHSPSTPQRMIIGVHRLVGITRIIHRILHLPSFLMCNPRYCMPPKLLGLQTLKLCWRRVLTTGLSLIRLTNPYALLREEHLLLLDISFPMELHSAVVMAMPH
jgi:hypothetical protein